MKNLDFDWQINEFMLDCRTTQLREKSMKAYEQTLRLFERWCQEQLDIQFVFFIAVSRKLSVNHCFPEVFA